MWLAIWLLACSGDEPTPGPTGWSGAGDACLSCHEGAEAIHPSEAIPAGECSVCHGGDDTALTKELAHVPVPDDWQTIRGDGLPWPVPDGYIKDFAPNQLDQLPVEYVRFINPGDMRAADETCGGCHPDEVANFATAIMTTNAGHYMPTLFLAGYQDTDAIYGSIELVDEDCEPGGGVVCDLIPLEPPPHADFQAAAAAGDEAALERIAYDHYLSKSCDTCHAAGYGDNNAPYKYRSTGCTSCHMIYDKTGFYFGDDDAIPSATPSFPAKHEITAKIKTQQCATCHFQGGRIGLLYRGIREAGFGEAPPNALAWEPGAYGKTNPDFYLEDEDTTNSIDETPPDVHWAAGLHCADCHVGSDVHGDGNIYSTSKQQADLSCEDCHGTIRAEAAPDGEGVFRTGGRGRALPQLSSQDGDVVLSSIEGKDHVIPQVARVLADAGPGSQAHLGMGEDDDGWSHTDDLTCDSCHTSYNEHCLGCHVSMDARFDQVDHQTGLSTPGLVKGSREMVSLDDVLLAMAPDGRAQSVVASQQVQMVVTGEDGERLMGVDHPDGGDLGQFRRVGPSQVNNGFHVFFQHTVSAAPRGCDACHRADDSPEELARVRGVYGHGTGEFMLEHPDGSMVDALQFLDDEGNALTDWVHEGTGPLPAARRDRALSVQLDGG